MKRSSFVPAILAMLVLASCGGTAAPASTNAGAPGASSAGTSPNAALSIAVGVTPNTLDPLTALGGELNPETGNVLQPLFKVDEQKNVIGLTAQSYEQSSDGLTATIKLRPNVTFHDGTKLDANAVKFNFERAADPKHKANNIDYYKNMKDIAVVDATTVKLTLNQPSPVLPFILTTSASAMISPTSATAGGNTESSYQHPVGTGPYALKDYTPGDHATLERYDKYWGTKPYYQKITYRFVPEDNSRESLLLSKQVDVIATPPLTDIANLQQNKAVKVSLNLSNRNMAVFMETQWPGLTDVRVRQALNYAVDKDAGLKAVLYGLGQVMQAPTALSDFGSCKTGSYAYDPAKAKSLLQEAGATNLKLPMVSPTGRYPQDYQTAEVVANYLKQAGVQVDLQTMAWPALAAGILSPLDKQTSALKLLGIGGTTVDTSTILASLTKSTFPPKGINVSFFSTPQTEDLFQKQAVNLDKTSRAAQLCDMEKAVWNDAPWIFLWNPKYAMAYQSNLDGLAFDYGDPEQFILAGMHPAK